MYIKVTTGGTGTLPVITGTGTGTMPGGTTGTGSTGTMSPTGGNGTTCDLNKILIMLNDNKLMKGKALRKHSLHEKTAASVLLKLFISGNE